MTELWPALLLLLPAVVRWVRAELRLRTVRAEAEAARVEAEAARLEAEAAREALRRTAEREAVVIDAVDDLPPLLTSEAVRERICAAARAAGVEDGDAGLKAAVRTRRLGRLERRSYYTPLPTPEVDHARDDAPDGPTLP